MIPTLAGDILGDSTKASPHVLDVLDAATHDKRFSPLFLSFFPSFFQQTEAKRPSHLVHLEPT